MMVALLGSSGAASTRRFHQLSPVSYTGPQSAMLASNPRGGTPSGSSPGGGGGGGGGGVVSPPFHPRCTTSKSVTLSAWKAGFNTALFQRESIVPWTYMLPPRSATISPYVFRA